LSLIGFTGATTELEKLIPGATIALGILYWGSLRKATYRCRELVLISVSGSKYFTLVGTHFIESAKLQSISDRSNARTLVANLRWGAGF
jgi:hypothetical protein